MMMMIKTKKTLQWLCSGLHFVGHRASTHHRSTAQNSTWVSGYTATTVSLIVLVIHHLLNLLKRWQTHKRVVLVRGTATTTAAATANSNQHKKQEQIISNGYLLIARCIRRSEKCVMWCWCWCWCWCKPVDSIQTKLDSIRVTRTCISLACCCSALTLLATPINREEKQRERTSSKKKKKMKSEREREDVHQQLTCSGVA